jgi:hypothetical protein
MAISQKPSPLWNVPYQRNKFFTERDNALQILRQELQMRDAVALSQPQAITGLGCIGKTQMALEYAHRYGASYAAVLWIRADSPTSLVSSFVELAHVLNLPVVQAVLQDALPTSTQIQWKQRTVLAVDAASQLIRHLVVANGLPTQSVFIEREAPVTLPNKVFFRTIAIYVFYRRE